MSCAALSMSAHRRPCCTSETAGICEAHSMCHAGKTAAQRRGGWQVEARPSAAFTTVMLLWPTVLRAEPIARTVRALLSVVNGLATHRSSSGAKAQQRNKALAPARNNTPYHISSHDIGWDMVCHPSLTCTQQSVFPSCCYCPVTGTAGAR